MNFSSYSTTQNAFIKYLFTHPKPLILECMYLILFWMPLFLIVAKYIPSSAYDFLFAGIWASLWLIGHQYIARIQTTLYLKYLGIMPLTHTTIIAAPGWSRFKSLYANIYAQIRYSQKHSIFFVPQCLLLPSTSIIENINDLDTLLSRVDILAAQINTTQYQQWRTYLQWTNSFFSIALLALLCIMFLWKSLIGCFFAFICIIACNISLYTLYGILLYVQITHHPLNNISNNIKAFTTQL